MSRRVAENTGSGIRAALVGWLAWYATPVSGFVFAVLDGRIADTLSPEHLAEFVAGSAIALGITGGAGAYYRDRRSPVEEVRPERVIVPAPTPVPLPAPPRAPAPPPIGMAALRTELERDEGRVDAVYLDSEGHRTAGIGHLLTAADREFSLPVGTPVAPERVDQWFAEDVSSAIADAEALVPDFDTHPAEVRRVLANMAFNLGRDRLGRFVNTLALVRARRYRAAADEALNSKWATQVGVRADRLANRLRAIEPDVPLLA